MTTFRSPQKNLWPVVAISVTLCVVSIGWSNTLRDYAFQLLGLNVYSADVAAAELPAVPRIPVLDGTLFKDKPDLRRAGFPPIEIVYESKLWAAGEDRSALPTPFRMRTVVGRWKRESMLVLDDLEEWAFFDRNRQLNQGNFDRYLKLVELAKTAAPEVKIGFYGAPPLADYWRAIDNNPRQRRADWQRENDAIQALADLQDVLYPSLYTFYADQKGWVEYARAQIAEARRMAKGKPVFAFLWPEYHNSNQLLGCQFVGEDYWRLQLETVSRLADGMVIWGGWDVCSKPGGQRRWDANSKWWAITQTFLAPPKQ